MSGSHPVASHPTLFTQGEEDGRDTLRVLRQLAGPSFRLGHLLDFGCGAGRLTIPLARAADRVTAVDVSPERIGDARQAVRDAGLSNVELVVVGDNLAGVSGSFEVVHSYVAFQRIPLATGYPLTEAVLDRVTPRGGGMLHFTYGAEVSTFRRAVRSSGEVMRRWLDRAEHAAPEPTFEYDLGRVFAMLQGKRFDRVAIRFTKSDGHLGAKLFFWRGY